MRASGGLRAPETLQHRQQLRRIGPHGVVRIDFGIGDDPVRADHAVRGTGELRGMLRIGLSSSFAVREIIPRLPGFLDRHPALRIDLAMTDRRQNLVSEGVDVALRFGPLADSTAVARRIARGRRLLVAAPAYLAHAGAPAMPADLAQHALIVGPTGRAIEGWTFEKDGRTLSMRIEGRLTIDANEGAVAAAVAGLGIVSTGEWGCRIEVESGTLVEVLPDWRMETVDIFALFAAGRAANPSARAFAAYLADSFRKWRFSRCRAPSARYADVSCGRSGYARAPPRARSTRWSRCAARVRDSRRAAE